MWAVSATTRSHPPSTRPPKPITLLSYGFYGSGPCWSLKEGLMFSSSFGARATFRVDGKVGSKEYELYRLDALDKQGISTRHLPFSLRILLENLLRAEDGRNVTKGEIRALA